MAEHGTDIQNFFEILQLKPSVLTLHQQALLRRNNVAPFCDYASQATPASHLTKQDEVEHCFEIFKEYPYDFISEYNRMITALCTCANMTLVTDNNGDMNSISYETYDIKGLSVLTRSTAEVLRFVVQHIDDPSIQSAVSDTIAKRDAIAMQIAAFNYKCAGVVKYIIQHRARFPDIIFKFNETLRQGWAAQALRTDNRLMANMDFTKWTISVQTPETKEIHFNKKGLVVYYTDDALLEVYRQNSSLLLGEIDAACAYISHSRAIAETLSRCILRILEPTPELVEIVNHMHKVIRTSWLLQNIPGDNRLISNLEGPQYLVAKLENPISLLPQWYYTPEQCRPDFLYYTKKELETVYRDNCVLIEDHLRMLVSHR